MNAAPRGRRDTGAAATDAGNADGGDRPVRDGEVDDTALECLLLLLEHTLHREQVLAAMSMDAPIRSLAELSRTAQGLGCTVRTLRIASNQFAGVPRRTILLTRNHGFVVVDRAMKAALRAFTPDGDLLFIESLGALAEHEGLAIHPRTEGLPKGVWAGKSPLHYLRHLVGSSAVLRPIILTSVLLQVFAIGIAMLSGTVIDRVLPRSDWVLFLATISAAIPLIILKLAAHLVRAQMMMDLRGNTDNRLLFGFLDHLLRLPFDFFKARPTGDLVMRFNASYYLRDVLTAGLLSTLLDVCFGVICLVILICSNLVIGLITMFFAGVQVLAVVLAWKVRARLWQERMQAQRKCQIFEHEIISGVETIKIAGAERRMVGAWLNLYAEAQRAQHERWRLDGLLDAVGGTVRGGAPLLVLLAGTSLVLANKMSLGEMISLHALAAGFLVPLSSIVGASFTLQMLSPYMERIREVFQASQEVERPRMPPSRLEGAISLERVTFRQGDRTIIEDVSLEIAPGEFVAIVGRSGAGKSTLMRVLLGLFVPSSGTVRFDGIDAKSLDMRLVREQIGVVPQDPSFFSVSVAANIAMLDPTVPEERVRKAAAAACAHDFIQALPEGYLTTTPGDSVSSPLSRGERQRLAMARALAREPRILVLDEATSAVDEMTQAKLLQVVEQLDCTRVVIAHRLSTVRNADRIVVLDAGKVVEVGTHDELLVRRGQYAQLLQLQLQVSRAVNADSDAMP